MNTSYLHHRGRLAAFLVALMVAAIIPAVAIPAGAVEPVHLGVTFEGCRGSTGSFPAAGPFVCADSEYTTGNLGGGWNELDLVPHRLTLSLGSQAAATTVYDFAIMADYKSGAATGYDFISVPVVNAAKSHASCAIGPVGAQTATAGDAEQYRMVRMTQNKGTTCVLDYYERLALGSALYPGASLHSHTRNENLGTQGIGNRDISIPVNEIAPQSISKDMSATQGSDHAWNVTKSPSPASLNFDDTCLAGAGPYTRDVSVTVNWTKLAATPSGDINITTNVYATNPSHRVITVHATDVVKSGNTPVTALTGSNTASTPAAGVDVPANTTDFLLFTHTLTVAAGTANLNDTATASYEDKVTGFPITGTTTANATATVQNTGPTTNATAVITDVESITGTGLDFKVNSATGAGAAGGSFGAYVLGTYTTGPVSWTSASQSASGSVTFNKTVRLDQPRIITGTLTDTATVTGSNGSVVNSDPLNIGISSTATTTLNIDKTIPVVLGAGDANQVFTFNVTGPNSYSSQQQITFTSGDGGASNPKSVAVTGLAPGSYTVAEVTLAPYAPQPNQIVNLTLPVCSGTASFNNGFGPATAQVRKVTVPVGTSAGWEFTLNGPGAGVDGETVTTAAGDPYLNFTTALEEGNYTITETDGPSGYDQTGASTECSFTVNYPADADRVFQCTYTNTQRGRIIIDKVTVPSGDSQSFAFTLTGGPSSLNQSFNLTDAATPHDSGTVLPGSGYSAEETVPAGWKLQSATCSDGSPVTNIDVAAGETVTCTFTNKKLGTVVVNKAVNGQPLTSGQSYTFQVRQGASGVSHGTVIATDVANFANGGVADFDPPTSTGGTTKFVAPKYFVPGSYQLCETLAPFWSVDMGGGEFVPTLMDDSTADNSTRCINFSITSTDLNKVFNVNNIPPPSGDARTIGFWKNWSGNCTGGKQANVLQNTLNLGAIMIGDLEVDQACTEAYPILNKSDRVSGKKMASHPAYNMAAQLLAALLNDQKGVPLCGAAVNAAASGQALLDSIGFTATGIPSMTKAQKADANTYAGILDDFNNNTLACP